MRAGGPVREISPEMKMLVSRTTRRLSPHCRHLVGDLLRRKGAELAGGTAYFPNHPGEPLAAGSVRGRFQDRDVSSAICGHGFAPALDPGRGITMSDCFLRLAAFIAAPFLPDVTQYSMLL
jgi:hypothetical protein